MLQSMYNSLSSHMYTDKKAPNSFSLFVTKRRNEQEGHYISIEQLTEEWQQMSKEQKAEFQNQSQCIQFTLDIDHRSLTDHKKPSISSSMIIPNDHSPVLHLFDHFQPPPTSSDQPTSPTFQKLNLSYSAAAEAAALESLSFNSHSVKQTTAIKRKYGILPEKVKRPPNAYLLFNRDMRRQLHDVNQGLSSGEISKTISMKWKQLSPAEKEYYLKEESKLKQQHNNEHANFIYSRRSKAEIKQASQLKRTHKASPIEPKKKPNLIGGRDPRGRKKKKADDTLPKHPMSAYLHFAKKMRPIMKKRYPEARLVEISKEIGNQWRSMSTADLQPWIDLANQDKARYAREMKSRIMKESSQSMDALGDLDSDTIATVAQMVNPTIK